MKKLALMLAVVFVAGALLISCDESTVTPSSTGEGTTAAPTTIDVQTPTPTPTSTPASTETPVSTELPDINLGGKITVAYINKAGTKDLSNTGDNEASIAVGSNLGSGDKITVTLEEGQKYFFLKISEKLSEALIYAPEGTYTFTAPTDMGSYYPSSILLNIKVRYPNVQELLTKRNIALNPFDTKTKKSDTYPHAWSNNNYNTSEFGAHCAIDGFTQNKGHGTYPLQSWGPKDTVLKTDKFIIDFGREVNVNELVLFIRADFAAGTSHDAYFSEITVKFSDGTSVVINPKKTADAQTFDLGNKTTTSVTLTGFVTDKTNSMGWAAITEVEVYGAEALK